MTRRADAPRIVIIFRNDDPSARSDAEHERRVAAVFERHGVRQTLGVVPEMTAGSIHDPAGRDVCPLTPDAPMAGFLREYVQRSGSEVALHGLTHRTSRFSRPSRREYFEFRVHSAAEQESMMRRGTDLLAAALGVRVSTFIPPWNRLDQNTLIACRRTGYTVVSAGPYTPEWEGLVPCGTDTDLQTFPRALERLRAGGRRAVLKVLYHSRSIRTDEEWGALSHAVEAAATAADCEVLTVGDFASRDPDLARASNGAARVIVSAPLPDQPTRGRSAVYRRLLRDALAAAPLKELQARGGEHYQSGDYESASRADRELDTQSRRLLAAARATTAAAALGAGAAAALLLGPRAAALWCAGLAVIVSLAAGAAWIAATSPHTRREIATAALCALGGAAAGVALGWLFR